MSTNKRKQSEIHPDLLFTSPTIHLVQPQPIPSTTLLNVEYPGILTHDTEPQLSRAQYTSLDRALSTLHPSALPSLTSSPHEALKFLSKIPNEGLKAVECRLGAFPSHPLSSHQHESATTLNHANIHQVYRAPLIGEAVPTHNIVIRIIKRTWRQKKRKHNTTPPSPAQHKSESAYQNGIALDPALFTDKDLIQNDRQHKRTRYTGRTKKEYIVEILGMATNTVRFRSMADFAFQPQVCVDSTSSSSQTMQLDPVMALHKALATMDLEAFQRFSIPEQLEDYQIASSDQEKSIQSNLGMVPPAFFSRMDVPFNYSFVQTPYSELRMVPTPVHLTRPSTSASFAHALKQSDIPPASMQRFVNRVRLSNIAPQPFRVGRDTEIPTKPLADVVRIEHRCDAQVLARLRELLVQRPVWSRMALKNQLNPVESKELQGTNEKVYFALVSYSMVGGPWRDTLVRFGYDVRNDAGSRIYQRIFLRGTGGTGSWLTNREIRNSTSETRTHVSIDHVDAVPVVVEEDQDGGDDEQGSFARSSVIPTLITKPSLSETNHSNNNNNNSSHVFDGISLHRNVANFQLCDIQDELIQPYIWRCNDEDLGSSSVVGLEPMGIEWLRKRYHVETGWYTRRALEMIRALVTARFRGLIESVNRGGRTLDEVDLREIVKRLRLKWIEEDNSANNHQDIEMCQERDEDMER